ncbi:50S ribosome-binding protein YggL [Geopseudomonas aromaticivorans]
MISPIGRGTATDDDRQAVLEWLEAWPGVEHVAVGDLIDGWYGWD